MKLSFHISVQLYIRVPYHQGGFTLQLRKLLTTLTLAAVTAVTAVSSASAATTLPLYLNGQPLTLANPPVIVNDRTLVPVRGYMEALGATVYWEPPGTVVVQWEDRTVTLRIGEKSARVGTAAVALDVPAQIIDDRTYVPLRFLSEGLGAKVEYDGKAVYVSSPVGTRVVFDGPLNVRAAPNMTAPVLMTVPTGTRFSVMTSSVDWTQVTLPRGQTGWVATRYTIPLPQRPPIDPFADLLNQPTAYLQVQGQCIGSVPLWNNRMYAPLDETVAALGATVSDNTVHTADTNWPVPQSDVARVGGQTFLPVETLVNGLGLSFTWDESRRTGQVAGPGGPKAGAQGCSPSANVGSYLIMDARSGLVLAEQKPDQTRQVASITKIMTAMLALEKGNPDSVVTASKFAASQVCTCMGLRAGDKVKLGDMLYGLMLPSGNDAAVAIAEHLSGTEPAFAKLMTGRAAQLGATHSLFYNASGLDDYVRPYSTARDMAVIAREALKNPEFREVVSEDQYTFAGPRGPWIINNKNDFVLKYPGATGVKNGWTELAGHTLVASAYRGGTELIVVVLGAPTRDQLYATATRLMDQGFQLASSAWLLH